MILDVDEEQISALMLGRVLVLTGAGISVASGLPTFRGNDGLYEDLNPYELASPEAFKKHPVTVWNWYLTRIRQGAQAKPNAAHLALVHLEEAAQEVTIITSNVDPLHRLAGSKRVFQLHGNIMQTLCQGCGRVDDLSVDLVETDAREATLPTCSCGGLMRPNVVWFGEYPREDAFLAAEGAIPVADILLEIGTSGTVNYGFAQRAAHTGVPVIRINPDGQKEPGVTLLREPAEVAVPRLVAQTMALV